MQLDPLRFFSRLVVTLAVVATFVCPADAQDDGAAEESSQDTRAQLMSAIELTVDAVEKIQVPQEIVVTLWKGIRQDQFLPVLKHFDRDAAVIRVFGNGRVCLVKSGGAHDQQLVERLRSHPYVYFADANYRVQRTVQESDPVWSDRRKSWGLDAVGAKEAWQTTTGGARVAVVDSGAWRDHEDLKNVIDDSYSVATGNSNLETGEVEVWEKRENSSPVLVKTRAAGHGTHVAGTIAAERGNSMGTVGVAPDSPVTAIQVLTHDDNIKAITGSQAAISEGIFKAVESGAAVINMSLGTSLDEETTKLWKDAYARGDLAALYEIENAVKQWAKGRLKGYAAALDAATDANAIIVKSAGNSGYPADFDSICLSGRAINVGALEGVFTQDGTLQSMWRADFSNFGNLVDVSAPGVDIWSCYPTDSDYKSLQGTSMAAPHVSGAVALMKTLDNDVTREEAVDILRRTGTKLAATEKMGPAIRIPEALAELQKRRKAGTKRPSPPPGLIPERPAPPDKEKLPEDWEDILKSRQPWNHPEIQRLIDLWLSIATPKSYPALNPDYAPWWYDEWGRLRCKQITAKIPPDWAPQKYQFLWERSKQYDSERHLTLYEFIVASLRNGTFQPLPEPLPIPPDRDPNLGAGPGDGLAVEGREYLGAWKGKDSSGEPIEVTFRRDGKLTVVAEEISGVFVVDVRAAGGDFTAEVHVASMGISRSRLGLRMHVSGQRMQLTTSWSSKIPATIGEKGASFYELERTAGAGNGPDFPVQPPPFVPGRLPQLLAGEQILQPFHQGTQEIVLGVSRTDARASYTRPSAIHSMPHGYDLQSVSCSRDGDTIWAMFKWGRYSGDRPEGTPSLLLSRMSLSGLFPTRAVSVRPPEHGWGGKVLATNDGSSAWIVYGRGNFRTGFGRIFYVADSSLKTTQVLDTYEQARKAFGGTDLSTEYATVSSRGDRCFCLTSLGVVAISMDGTCQTVVPESQLHQQHSSKKNSGLPSGIAIAGETPVWAAQSNSSAGYGTVAGIGSRRLGAEQSGSVATSGAVVSRDASRHTLANFETGFLGVFDRSGDLVTEIPRNAGIDGHSWAATAAALSPSGQTLLYEYRIPNEHNYGLMDLATGSGVMLPDDRTSAYLTPNRVWMASDERTVLSWRATSQKIGYNPSGLFVQRALTKPEPRFPQMVRFTACYRPDHGDVLFQCKVDVPGTIGRVSVHPYDDDCMPIRSTKKSADRLFPYHTSETSMRVNKDQPGSYYLNLKCNAMIGATQHTQKIRVRVFDAKGSRVSCFDYQVPAGLFQAANK